MKKKTKKNNKKNEEEEGVKGRSESFDVLNLKKQKKMWRIFIAPLGWAA